MNWPWVVLLLLFGIWLVLDIRAHLRDIERRMRELREKRKEYEDT